VKAILKSLVFFSLTAIFVSGCGKGACFNDPEAEVGFRVVYTGPKGGSFAAGTDYFGVIENVFDDDRIEVNWDGWVPFLSKPNSVHQRDDLAVETDCEAEDKEKMAIYTGPQGAGAKFPSATTEYRGRILNVFEEGLAEVYFEHRNSLTSWIPDSFENLVPGGSYTLDLIKRDNLRVLNPG